jgi:cell division septum initiation protein DivIVA
MKDDAWLEQVEQAYERLSMIHSETLLENARLRKEIDRLSGSWWSALKHKIKRKFSNKQWYED